MDVKEKKLLYHLTRIDNLESIIQYGLLPRNALLNSPASFYDVADPQIIRERGLGAYIPFHFHTKSAFDYAVAARLGGWEKLIYLCVTREYARQQGFKIIPAHPLTTQNISNLSLMDYDAGLAAIDWKLMECDCFDRNDVKQVRMAECLTNVRIPFKDFRCIFYLTPDQKDKIEALFQKMGITYWPPFINDGTKFHR